MTNQPHLPIGSRVGNYRIVGRIGEGGMGIVYAAEHVELGKRVAIKTLHAKLAADEPLRARFLREGRAAAAVRHPHVVDVHDVGVHEDMPYLVMELLDGQDLAAYVSRHGKLRPEEAVDLLLPVLLAMAAAHRVGVVHRDLKPENVFLARGAGGRPTPKVLDFGISKVREIQSMSLTGGGTLLGTPYYMSPEQASNAKDVDARADVYSLGVVLYHCVSGQVPFQATSLVQLIGRIMHAEPPPLAEQNLNLPPGFEQVIRRAMAKDPAQRYASADGFGRALLPFASARARMLLDQEFAPVAEGAFNPFAATAPSGSGHPLPFDPTAVAPPREVATPASKRSLVVPAAGAVIAVVAAAVLVSRIGSGTGEVPASSGSVASHGAASAVTPTAPPSRADAPTLHAAPGTVIVPATPTAVVAAPDAGAAEPTLAPTIAPTSPTRRTVRRPAPAVTPTAPPSRADAPVVDPFSDRK